ncbi:MAG: ClpP family protease [Candidatus Spyradocola sp.]|jgi:ATP-dependent protease ClpP protease subunit
MPESKNTSNLNALTEMGVAETPESPIACVSIIGQIEGHMVLPETSKATKYEHILPMLVNIEQSETTKGFLLVLNTVGGDVEAGLAIAEMVAGMRKPSVSLVIGGGHSIGVPLAVCARKSFIVPTATMTLHPVRVSGMVINAPQSVDYLRQMQARVVRFVCAHSGLREEEFYRMLEAREDMANDVGTILDGEAAVRCGLIDQIGGVGDALDALRKMLPGERAETHAR